MPRVLWKGAISFGLVNIPVNLYSADSRNDLDMTMLDRKTLSPIGYERINKKTGKKVPWEDIVKGYEYEKERYVVLSDEDFRRANVEATQTVDILGFVEAGHIPILYYETPYYLTPGKRGEKGYVLLRETLKRTGKVGIAQVVIRTKQRLAALTPVGNLLVLDTLRYGNEVRDTKDLDLPTQELTAAGVNPKELEIAERLVENMTEDWNPEKYRDTYREDILALVEKKIQAGQTEVITQPDDGKEETQEERSRGKVVDLMALLKRSVEANAKDRPARRAGAPGRRGRKPASPRTHRQRVSA